MAAPLGTTLADDPLEKPCTGPVIALDLQLQRGQPDSVASAGDPLPPPIVDATGSPVQTSPLRPQPTGDGQPSAPTSTVLGRLEL